MRIKECTLIRIGVDVQCTLDMLGIESSILQKPRLASSLFEVARTARAEFLGSCSTSQGDPIEVAVLPEIGFGQILNTACGKLLPNPDRPLTAACAAAGEALDEALHIEETLTFERVEDALDRECVIAASSELSLELEPTMIAARQKIERLAPAGSRVHEGAIRPA